LSKYGHFRVFFLQRNLAPLANSFVPTKKKVPLYEKHWIIFWVGSLSGKISQNPKQKKNAEICDIVVKNLPPKKEGGGGRESDRNYDFVRRFVSGAFFFLLWRQHPLVVALKR
jgi:hypothetical protein